MKKAIFLDRDGVINRERGDYTYLLEDFIINEGIIEFLKICQEKGYLLIIISNQGGIPKKIYTKEDVENLHKYFVSELTKNEIVINEFYFCPHHQDYTNCLCRKPGSLMIEKALARFNIDKSKSFFIGDTKRDIEAAQNAGVNAIKVVPNENLLNNQQIKYWLISC